MFLADPLGVPQAVVDYLGGHADEIKRAFGLQDFAAAEEDLERWVDARAWTTGDGPRAIFDDAVVWLFERRVVRDAWHDDEQRATARRSVIDDAGDVLDEVRAESNGFARAVAALGDAVFVFAAHVERGGNPPRVEIATCLEDALGWLCAAIACTDALLVRRPVRRAG